MKLVMVFGVAIYMYSLAASGKPSIRVEQLLANIHSG